LHAEHERPVVARSRNNSRVMKKPLITKKMSSAT
jgi:hypothetical protein